MSRLTLASRRTVSCSTAWFLGAMLVFLVGGTAMADTLDRALAAWQAGRTDDARGLLLDYLLEEDTDADRILSAARLAMRLDDLDLIERTLGRSEIAAGERADPRLDLAMGLSYLALADGRLRRGVQGPTLAMLFADAEARALKVKETPAWAPEGRVLLARTRHAGGDLPGAIEALEGGPMESAREHYWLGRLLYERALRDGRTPDLHAARGQLQNASPDALEPEEARLAHLTSAWIAHRLASQVARERDRDAYIGEAVAMYEAAWRRDPTSPLPLRGLQSLYANDPARLAATFETMLEAEGEDTVLLDALIRAWLDAKDGTRALLTLQRRIAVAPEDATAWIEGGRVFLALQQWREARKHLLRAMALDPSNTAAAGLMDQLARSLVAIDADRGIAVYEELLAARPDDPYIRNNYGFILRELVTPHTTVHADGMQTLKEDAPPRARKLLERCRDVYAEAVALLPESEDADREEMAAWNLAGIVNDYGLILHYFADIQDGPLAEEQYLRALRMTDHGFKDTYVPNLRRLYTEVLTDRELALFRLAREARYAILKEAVDASGRLVLVPDEEKRALAARDEAALRTRLLQELEPED